MNYKTKDGAVFTAWWHPFAYMFLLVLCWPLYFIGNKHQGYTPPGAGCMVVVLGWMISLTVIAAVIAFCYIGLHLAGKLP